MQITMKMIRSQLKQEGFDGLTGSLRLHVVRSISDSLGDKAFLNNRVVEVTYPSKVQLSKI